ncbi:MAG: hypothetical protein WDN02_12775 [Methylovirgula sp.]|uniref:hypothetical protein n=1 Tax=Methylovirgula sp. TaxID=1978224 RepID=UPI0030764AC4
MLVGWGIGTITPEFGDPLWAPQASQFIGLTVGTIVGGYSAATAQNYAIQKLPLGVKQSIGQDNMTYDLETDQHGKWQLITSAISFLIFFKFIRIQDARPRRDDLTVVTRTIVCPQ